MSTITTNINAQKIGGLDNNQVPFINSSTSGLTGSTLFTYDGTSTLSVPMLSATTIYSGSTDLNTLFTQNINQINTKANLSGATFTGAISASNVSATTISGNTFYGSASAMTGIFGSFGLNTDAGVSVITNGIKGYAVMPYNAIITGWDIISNISGNCAVDVWKNNSIPTSANTITGNQMPILSNQQLNSNNNLTGWTSTILKNDIICFNVISATTISRINLIIKVIKN